MLEPDSPDTTSADQPAAAVPAKRTPRKRAPRKTAASPPAALEPAANDVAPNDVAPNETDPTASPPSEPARSQPPRKRASRKAATNSGTDSAPPAELVDGTAAAAPTPDAAASKTPRKRPSRKSGTGAESTAAADRAAPVPAQTGARAEAGVPADAGATGETDAAPVKAPRKRASRKKATAPAPAPSAAEAADGAPGSDTQTTPGLVFLAPARDAEPAEPVPAADGDVDLEQVDEAVDEVVADPEEIRDAAIEQASGARRRRRRGRRGRGGRLTDADEAGSGTEPAADDEAVAEPVAEAVDDAAPTATARRRRRRRSDVADDPAVADDPPNTVVHVREPRRGADDDGVRGVKGSTRLEAKRQRRRDGRETTRRRVPILTEAEFLARREAVERAMVVRQNGERTQIAVLEDGILVEHYVTRATATSYVGSIYLGRVQNVLPSMEAAFVDIGKGRNGVLYAGEVNWDAAGLEGKSRAIENALKSGDTVLVQVTKDPIGHKGARLTSQVSLPGRFLVYVPRGGMTGISRRLPDTERHRLKAILKKIVPEDAGVIVRTAAEGASEEELTHDVERLTAQWQQIEAAAARTSSAPSLLHGEADLAIRVVRDVFNEDFSTLTVQGAQAWDTVSGYIGGVAPDLAGRIARHTGDTDLFHELRIDEQLMKALDRKVWLPSGGSLVIDRTEAMTVIDVNTGKFVGAGGNLEQTVTRNNLEAAEEIVRQLRLRDVGGIVVIDFIDMVLESNRDLVLRRLTECLGRDRTKHQVAEVTSLGLVQMTRKRVGEGLLEAFSEPCEHCQGRGVIVHIEPVDVADVAGDDDKSPGKSSRKRGGRGGESADRSPSTSDEQRKAASAAIAAIHRAAHPDGDAVDGDAVDGDAVDGDAVDGDAVDGDAVDGDAVAAEGPVGLVTGSSADLSPVPRLEVETDDPDSPPADVAAPEHALPVTDETDEPVEPAGVATPAAEQVPALPPPRRRRRMASRPAGPPAVVG